MRAADDGRRAYRAFGGELGLLFQIVDDILDETGSDEALGKQAGADERRGGAPTSPSSASSAPGSWRWRARGVAFALLDGLPGRPRSLAAIVERVYRRDR